MTLISAIGISASAFTAVSLLPQLVKLIKEKKADDVSLGMMAILFAGLGLWVYYGLLKNDWIIIAANTISLTLNVLLTAFAIKYKNKRTVKT